MDIEEYVILPAQQPPELQGLWDGPVWRHAPILEVAYFRPESGRHRPLTQCRLLYGPDRLYGLFRVQDRYVRCIHTAFQADVYKDSCVEFFVQPKASGGYFNFEFNCGGALLASFVTDPTRVDGRLKEHLPLSRDDDRQVRRHHSLPAVVEPEVTEAVVWLLEFSIPFTLLERYAGPLGEVGGQVWRANFFKCGNETSHPHWGAWAPVGELNFHAPGHFGAIRFGGRG